MNNCSRDPRQLQARRGLHDIIPGSVTQRDSPMRPTLPLLMILLVLLAGCGTKGPLYLPDDSDEPPTQTRP